MMYSCIHCPDINANRSSFNRHLKNHISTDVGFITSRFNEVTIEKTCVSLTNSPLGDVKAKEDYDQPASSEEVSDILKRYEHLNIGLVLVSPPSQSDSQLTEEAETGVLQLVERREKIEDVEEKMEAKVKQTMSEANGGTEKLELFKVSDNKSAISTFPKEEKTPIKTSDEKIVEQLQKYSCDECDKTFARKSSLQAHKIKHRTGEGRVQCEVCKKMFASKGSLLTHHQTHTGKKKYACQLCEDSYSKRRDLTDHEKTTHAEN